LILQVIKVYDHKNRCNVALKIVRNEKRFHKQAQEEIRILKHLRQQVLTARLSVTYYLHLAYSNCFDYIATETFFAVELKIQLGLLAHRANEQSKPCVHLTFLLIIKPL
jgi:hypothetical protein